MLDLQMRQLAAAGAIDSEALVTFQLGVDEVGNAKREEAERLKSLFAERMLFKKMKAKAELQKTTDGV